MPLHLATDAQWAWAFDLNVMSGVRAVDALRPYLLAAEEATIVLTASGSGFTPSEPDLHLGVYSATKHALVGYAGALRGEMSPQGVGVCVLVPSAVEGNLAKTSAASRVDRLGAIYDDQRARQPAHRELLSAEAIGPLLVSGLLAIRDYVFNNPEQLLRALTDHTQRISRDGVTAQPPADQS